MTERVVLLHGLWMNALALYPLQARIDRCGFAVDRFGYPSMSGAPEQSVGRLVRFVDGLRADKVHLVGHSLGGVLIVKALAQLNDSRVGRVVLLGSPMCGSSAGRGLSRFRGGRWLLGESLPLWTQRDPLFVPAGVEIGVIAGNLSIGLGRIVAQLPKPNDGVVTVAETRIPGATDSIELPVTHSAMIFAGSVAQQVCAFLKGGRFARA